MGFKSLTGNILRPIYNNTKKFFILDNTKHLAGDKYNIILFDANSLYYLIQPFIESYKLPDNEILECSAFLTASIILNIYNILGKKNNINNNVIGLF